MDRLAPQNTQGVAPMASSPTGGVDRLASKQPAKPEDSLFGSIVGVVANPFLRLGATAAKAVGGTAMLGKAGFEYITGNKEGAKKTIDKAIEFTAPKPLDPSGKLGLFGKADPIGTKDGKQLGGGDYAKDVVGTGAEIASYAVGGPKALSGIKAGKYAQSAVAGAEVGGLGAFGMSLQENVGSKEDAATQTGDIALDTLSGTFLGGALGLGGTAAVDTVKFGKNLVKPSAEFANKAESTLIESYGRALNLNQRQIRGEEKWARNTPEFLAKESVYNPELRLGQTLSGRLDTTRAVTGLEKLSKTENEAFRDILKAENKLASLEEYRANALKSIDTSWNRAKGGDYEKKVAQVNSEIDSLKRNYTGQEGVVVREDGDVLLPLDRFNEVKQGRWSKAKGFASADDKIFNDTNFEMGHVAKEMIENALESADAKAINKRLGDIASSIKILEQRHGGVIPGGRLGVGFAQILGGIAGSSRGPVESVMGALTAEKLAKLMMNPELGHGMKRWIITRVRNTPKWETVAQKAEKIMGQKLEQAMQQKALPSPSFVPAPGNPNAGGTPGRPNYNPPRTPASSPDAVIEPQSPKINMESQKLLPSGDVIPLPGKSSNNAFGAVLGLEPGTDEEGNQKLGFNPQKAALGAFAGAVATKAPKLTTKVLDQLKGKGVISKQFIADLTKSGGLKQAERDIINSHLADAPAKIDADDFANKVRLDLLELTPKESTDRIKALKSTGDPQKAAKQFTSQYESVTLPEDIRGPVAHYGERIYESPIKTSAGNVHFSGKSDNYFAHSRYEDLPHESYKPGEYAPAPGTKGSTRRIVEIQSDLFQKGRLEGEAFNKDYLPENIGKLEKYHEDKLAALNRGEKMLYKREDYDAFQMNRKRFEDQARTRSEELSQLAPYENTFHERIIREEVKKAAQDGKKILQFPTGETAMKIEGLGARDTWYRSTNENAVVNIDNIQVGEGVYRMGDNEPWIVTEILGDGKFRASNDMLSANTGEVYTYVKKLGKLDDGRMPTLSELRDVLSPDDFKGLVKVINDSRASETFDISGKVDTSNPIFKFYEKDIGRYLSNKYKAQRITDPQGVSWWQIQVPKEASNAPVEAFGLVPFVGSRDNKEQKSPVK